MSYLEEIDFTVTPEDPAYDLGSLAVFRYG